MLAEGLGGALGVAHVKETRGGGAGLPRLALV